MEKKHPIENLMLTAMTSLESMVDVNTIIGDTVSGRSIKVDITFLPLNWNFVISHDANNPKNVLLATAISETSSVSFIECRAYLSFTAARNTFIPFENAVNIT